MGSQIPTRNFGNLRRPMESWWRCPFSVAFNTTTDLSRKLAIGHRAS